MALIIGILVIILLVILILQFVQKTVHHVCGPKSKPLGSGPFLFAVNILLWGRA